MKPRLATKCLVNGKVGTYLLAKVNTKTFRIKLEDGRVISRDRKKHGYELVVIYR